MTTISTYTSRKIAILSFLSIISVVFIHARTIDHLHRDGSAFYAGNFIIQNFVAEGLCRTAVPFFFTFSGFLFFASLAPTFSGFKAKFASRVRTLIVPYLLWNCLGLLILYIVQSLHGNATMAGEKLIRSYTVIDFLNRLYPHPVQYQFWFLLDLLVYVLASPLLYLLIRYTGLLVPLLFGALYFSPVYKFYLHISDASLHPEGMLFFSLGAWAAIKGFRIPKVGNGVVVFLALAWIAVNLGKVFLLLRIGETYPYNIFHRATVVFGVFIVWRMYDLVPASWIHTELWKKLLPCTFFVFAFHEPAQTILRNEILKIAGNRPGMYSVCYGVCPLVTIALAVYFAWGLQKLVPRFYSVLTGGRDRRN